MKHISTLSTVFLLVLQCTAFAQQDTDLNSLRQAPPKESLPVKTPSLNIEEVTVPQSNLDLEINYWRNWTTFGINVNQASFSDNWNGGGVNSFSIGGLFNHKSEYNKDDKNFHTELMLQYGTLKNKDQLSRKSSDRIFWDNKGGVKLSKSWSFFASLALETQFVAGYTYKDVDGEDTRDALISNFFAPGYITESVGIEFVPDKTFSLRFGTGTARQTFILDDRLVFNDRKSFGVDTGKNFRNELAFQLVANLNRDLSENFNIKSRYAFFANYNELGEASHRLDATFTSRVSRVINVSLSGVLWYDKNISKSMQTSQSLALGVMYKFPR
ncbi:DUF3078 domain-containing protein [Albibacterium sp.]|uniref:DUF3078 domain-containing protein n=1 Tax=Albibacterium sp. TaxID=2952885 RepID=UPI002CE50728|nr:DUF3078 domain-containing protein [Albibacterium sp.]HUH20070.1 DUF3078 domain-containing protein [Albibacterium sp.]